MKTFKTSNFSSTEKFPWEAEADPQFDIWFEKPEDNPSFQ
jgi:hypothetical protein